MADAPTKPIDVTILSGFLGSGKTTLLCHLLASQQKDRVAVLENELGELAIDNPATRSVNLRLPTSARRTRHPQPGNPQRKFALVNFCTANSPSTAWQFVASRKRFVRNPCPRPPPVVAGLTSLERPSPASHTHGIFKMLCQETKASARTVRDVRIQQSVPIRFP